MDVLAVLKAVSGFVWGPPMLLAIMGVGVFLTVRIRAVSLRKIPHGIRLLLDGRSTKGEGVSPFSALMLSLSATIGTGNIAGVATAIAIGGPGALFWMWCSALVGMATKYGEAVCAVHFRERNDKGEYVGGPMYYIKNGLGSRWVWLATAFAIFGGLAGFGIGNMVQANSIAHALHTSFGWDRYLTSVCLAVLVASVLLGGVKRIADVARYLVPFMAIAYLVMGLVVIAFHIQALPEAFVLIVKSAFTPVAAQGGFAGAAVLMAIRMGVARGVFSNEAGLGSAPIAHAAASTDNPVKQGSIAMLGSFIDTIVVCSITGFAIVLTGVWSGGLEGVAISQAAFGAVLPYGDIAVSLALVVFAFTTILGWSYYGERCAEYLLGGRAVAPYRVLWVLAIPLGVMLKEYAGHEAIWLLADVLNALMALPNLVALVLLSGVIARLTNEYYFKK
ncbi:MAG: sodium:alanine symporter family protein [Alteromonadaceae bacterium]|nr:MAG: sodium:alanine symporter family protein [Alteromonadaceae bacterium]